MVTESLLATLVLALGFELMHRFLSGLSPSVRRWIVPSEMIAEYSKQFNVRC